MKLFSGFSRQEVQNRMEYEIVLSKLQLLASSLKNDTDKPSDLIHWQELMTQLGEIQVRHVDFSSHIRGAYQTLYTLYLKKHYPELLNTKLEALKDELL
ncbi:hypothetical protein PP175_27650 (plasmid) [Aneurinibacillus sp. Ricciae_BoGa-3]|uniref:hypothetical protein n=1 Tax=Aneurinibacillus sp. Ricciae_BoGa-3 TaxID=3022697 RepID=UPI0023420068|nr:hypothetical protein [Aneurinibacillus sp. Ricciae_BoGa-3]WCK56969.1 hypothetical protein PP175_27650 [Aneurinibacillus sp. Ricciae_BoGa-3]